MRWSKQIGNLLVNFIRIQYYFYKASFQGWILAGVFPAFFASVGLLADLFHSDSPEVSWSQFKISLASDDQLANKVDYTALGIFLVLWLDLKIINHFPQAGVYWIIPILLLLYCVILSHLPIVFVRYRLTLWRYFQQAGFIALASIWQVLAIGLSYLLLDFLYPYLGWLYYLLPIPILASPIAFFASQSIIHIKELKNNM